MSIRYKKISGRSIRAAAALLAVSSMVSGCTAIDHFGGRTVKYNLETSDSRSRVILSNVMRAAYGEPLQFGDISTITGQGNASATLTANIPLAAIPSTAPRVDTLGPSATFGGSSAVTYNPLNTQEFMQGMQTPITLTQIANLIDAGYDPRLVLFLTVSDISIADGTRRISYLNDAATPKGYGSFWETVNLLVSSGFSTQVSDGPAYGPEITSARASDPRVIASILASTNADLTLKPVGSNHFQFFRKGDLKVCFDRLKATNYFSAGTHPADIDPAIPVRAGYDQAIFRSLPLVLGYKAGKHEAATPVEILRLQIDPDHLCGFKPPKGARKPTTSQLSFTMKTRAVEGIFQYLGAVARAQTGLGGERQEYALPNEDPKRVSTAPYFFRVSTEQPAAVFASTTMHGSRYYVGSDSGGEADQSTRIFQMLTDLLALQSSAKNVPTPSVISVLGR